MVGRSPVTTIVTFKGNVKEENKGQKYCLSNWLLNYIGGPFLKHGQPPQEKCQGWQNSFSVGDPVRVYEDLTENNEMAKMATFS